MLLADNINGVSIPKSRLEDFDGPSPVFGRWNEFSSIVMRLDQLGEQVANIEELWARRLRVIQQIVAGS